MHRRRLLALLAAAPPSLAGCVGREPDATSTATSSTTVGDATTSTTDATTTTDGTTAAGDVSVSDVTVTPAVVAPNTPDSIAVSGDRREQFMLATVAAEGLSWPDHDAFALAADRDTYAPTVDVGYGHRIWGRGRPYGEHGDGWLAFRLPKPLDVDDARLAWPGGERALSADALRRLARPPTTFEVRAFTAPESVSYGESATAHLTVANVGDADGTFVGALNRVGPWVAHAPEAAISLHVAAGETASWEFTHTPERHGDGDDRSMAFKFNWRGGGQSRTVDVTGG